VCKCEYTEAIKGGEVVKYKQINVEMESQQGERRVKDAMQYDTWGAREEFVNEPRMD
jgi:hypothetical protein